MPHAESLNVGVRGSMVFWQRRVIAKLSRSQTQMQELRPPQIEQKRLRKGVRLLSWQKLGCSDPASFPHVPSPTPAPAKSEGELKPQND